MKNLILNEFNNGVSIKNISRKYRISIDEVISIMNNAEYDSIDENCKSTDY